MWMSERPFGLEMNVIDGRSGSSVNVEYILLTCSRQTLFRKTLVCLDVLRFGAVNQRVSAESQPPDRHTGTIKLSSIPNTQFGFKSKLSVSLKTTHPGIMPVICIGCFRVG